MHPVAIQYKFKLSPPCRQAGLSLVELMISLTIGLLLLLGLTTLVVQQSGSRDEMEKSGRQIENGRYAMQILHDDIQLAGFYGEYFPVSYSTPDPCDSASLGWDPATSTAPAAIYGYAGAATDPTPTACLNNYQPNTAVLVIRRTQTDTVAATAATAGTAYLQLSRCGTGTTAFVLGTGGFTLKQKDCSTVTPLRQYVVRIYYISSCSVCGSDTIPTLKMKELINGPSLTTTPLVEGIENMQFDYGVDSTGDGSPDDYLLAAAVTDWSNVMAVRVNLLARNNDPTSGHTDSKNYSLGGVGTVTPGGAYKRHAYSQLVRAINPSGRREAP